jgi:hypothetical protein
VIPALNSPITLYIAICIVFLLFIYRFFRGLSIGTGNTKFSLFHLFLYLCTLEILPYMIVAKLVLKYIFNPV